MKYEIKGNNLPYLVCYLNKDQSIVCEGGSMCWMTPNIQMNTSSNGGIGKVFSRMFSGEKLFQNIYTAQSDNGLISFASSFPGTILPIEIGPGKEVICQKKSFLAGTQDLELSVHFRKKIGVGIFGGEGLFNTVITGPGRVILQSMPISKTANVLADYMPLDVSGKKDTMDAVVDIAKMFGKNN